MPTLTITNLGGPLTRKNDGPVDSGLAKFETSHGYNPFTSPGNLTWNAQPTSILTLHRSSVAAGIMNMRTRLESLTPYIYGIDGDGKLRRISVTSNTTSILGTLPSGNNFTQGPGMALYGTTEKIFYGDADNIQKINFNGSSPSVIGASIAGQYPRPLATFLGKLYFGNGSNIGEIDTTELVTTGTKLSPGLPTGIIVRDLEVTPDGNYLQITATKGTPGGGYVEPLNTQSNILESYRFLWNGTDDTYSAFETRPATNLTANQIVGEDNYFTGFDITGLAIYSGSQKLLSLPNVTSPFPDNLFSLGNTLGVGTTGDDSSDGNMKYHLYQFGQYDLDVQNGMYRLLRMKAPTLNDIMSSQGCIPVTNEVATPTGISAKVGTVYFLTTETSDPSGDTDYIFRLWKYPYQAGSGSVVAGVYETQSQLFSKKVNVKEVRVYTDPLAGGNDFEVDVIGSGGSVLAGGSKKFAVGTTVTAGQDMVQYNPQSAPTYAVGIRITNASVTGVRNWTASKIEIDWEEAGK